MDSSEVKVLIKDNEFVGTLAVNEKGIIITSVTPFYAEMGGQAGDRGIISGSKFKAKVYDCKEKMLVEKSFIL